MSNAITIPFEQAFIAEPVGKRKIQESEYQTTGSICVVNQGQRLISGHTNRTDLLIDNGPYILFGDHTRVIKYVDFPFVAGADGVRLYKAAPEFNTEYLYLFLRSAELPADGYGRHSKYLQELEVPAVDWDQQRQIAASLKAQLAEVETARQAAQVQLRDAALLRQRLLRQTFDALAAGPHKVLGEWATVSSGVTPARDRSDYWQPAEVPWVKTGEIDFAPITSVQESISKKALAQCSLSLLPPKTVLVAITGEGKTRGRSAVLEVAATTNQHSVAILPNNTWDAYFLQLWMQSSYRDLRELSEGRGGSRSALSGGQMKVLKIPAPDIDDQLLIVTTLKQQLAEADALRTGLEQQLRDLDALPQRILTQAFNKEQLTG